MSKPRPLSFPVHVLGIYRELFGARRPRDVADSQVALDEQSPSDRAYHSEVLRFATLDQLVRVERAILQLRDTIVELSEQGPPPRTEAAGDDSPPPPAAVPFGETSDDEQDDVDELHEDA